MKEHKLKPCPFCGKTPIEGFPDFYENSETGIWSLHHFCPHEDGDPSVCVLVYGKTKEEVIERWNRRAEVETSESL